MGPLGSSAVRRADGGCAPVSAPCTGALGGWLARAAPGDRIAYWRGHLAVDLGPASGLDDDTRHPLAAAAALAWSLSDRGLVHLVQRRLGPDHFEYILELRPRRRGGADVARLTIR